MSVNIFSSLARYADRQEENFLTESFVYLLNVLMQQDNAIAIAILQKICGEKCLLWFSSLNNIIISTQLTTNMGRPDIVIKVDNNKIVFIEVKHDSHLGQTQLERYKNYLINSSYQENQLVLLTRSRHSIRETELAREQFHHVCWYEISGWLSESKFENKTAEYTVHQFLDFLREKEMSMERVSWEYMEGIPAMIKLANMLYTAIAEALPEERVRRTAGWNWMGYYAGDNNSFFIGFRYQDPLKVVFENNGGTNATFGRELSLLNSHFFALSAGQQLECLINFVRQAKIEYLKEYPGTANTT
jgi:hypothetical protein